MDALPANALIHLPTLVAEYKDKWPTVPIPSALAGQVEKESCITLKSKKCWSPYSELKTSRENGIGLGQVTIAYNSDGSVKFDNLAEARKLDVSLKDFTWENRYNATYQLRTLVLMDKFNYGKFSWATDTTERLAFALVAYNGGIGGVLSDRRVCASTDGCNVNLWFGHVEYTSKKAKVALKGYGKSFFEINREYPVKILNEKRMKYVKYMGE